MCSTPLNGIKLKICLVSDKNAILHKLSFNVGLSVLLLKKNVLQGQHEADKIWSKEGFYAVVIFLSIFVIIVTCLMVSGLLSVFYPLPSHCLVLLDTLPFKGMLKSLGTEAKLLSW